MSIYRLAIQGASAMPLPAGAAGAAPAPAVPAADQLAAAIQAITSFIPAETITLFVGVASIVASWNTHYGLVWWFIICALISPLFFVVASINAARSAGRTFTLDGRFVWRLLALLIAFVIWATAVSPQTLDQVATWLGWAAGNPQSPDNHILHDASSIAVLFTSPVLTAIDSLFR